jgi:hypothetical protein
MESTLATVRQTYYLGGDPKECSWRAFVENHSDQQLLSVVDSLSKHELQFVASFALVLCRINFLKKWWSDLHLQQLSSISQWKEVTLGLELYRIKIVKLPEKKHLVELLLLILQAPAFRKLYPQLFGHTNSVAKELVSHLIFFASSINSGLKVLYSQWKYFFSKNENLLQLTLRPVYKTNNIQLFVKDGTSNFIFKPIEKVLKYGSDQDLRVFLKHPDCWNQVNLLERLIYNKNYKTFQYMMNYFWTLKKLVERLPFGVRDQLWGEFWIAQFVTQQSINKLIEHLIGTNDWMKKLRVLFWIFPDYCSRTAIFTNLCKESYQKIPNMYRYNRYNCFGSLHFKQHHEVNYKFLELEKQQPVVIPNPTGKSKLYSLVGIYPSGYYPMVLATKIYVHDIQIYLVTDCETAGSWPQRMKWLSQQHDFSQYNIDHFLNVSKANNWTSVWWPIVPERLQGINFFKTLALPAGRSYPSDSWIIAGQKDTFEIPTGLNLSSLLEYYKEQPIYYPLCWKVQQITEYHLQLIDFYRTYLGIPSVPHVCGEYSLNKIEVYHTDPYTVVQQQNAGNDFEWYYGINWANVYHEKIVYHYAFQEFSTTWEKWTAFLQSLIHTKMIVTIHDAELLFTPNKSECKVHNRTMYRGSNTWHQKIWDGWIHNGRSSQRIPTLFLSGQFVKDELEMLGWRLKKELVITTTRTMYFKKNHDAITP